MAFTGTPVVTQINDRTVRITGISVAAANTVGTIGLAGATGTPPDIKLPSTFIAVAGDYLGQAIGLQDSIDVNINAVSAGALTNLMPSVAKTGTTQTDFRVSVTNTSASLATQTLEIVIQFRPSHVEQPSRVA